jgi:hypothetical protein
MAAPTVSVQGPAAVPWGTDVAVAGSTDTVAPLPGATVRLEVLAFPFDGAWAAGATVTADATGAFRGGGQTLVSTQADVDESDSAGG